MYAYAIVRFPAIRAFVEDMTEMWSSISWAGRVIGNSNRGNGLTLVLEPTLLKGS
jgi:hypothetical protein